MVDLVTLFLVVVDPDLVEDRRELVLLAACFFAVDRGAAFVADAFFVAFVPPAAFLVELRAADLAVAFLVAFLVAFFVAFFVVLATDFLAGADFFAGAFFATLRVVAPLDFLAVEAADFLAVAFFVDLAGAFRAAPDLEDFLADFLAVERFVATLPSPSLLSDRDGSHPLRGTEHRLDPSATPLGAARPIGRRIVEPSRDIRNDTAQGPLRARTRMRPILSCEPDAAKPDRHEMADFQRPTGIS
ncbi:MAG: hypothetical protein OEW83_02070 [Acidimicrobiia bacterium]|nr:hypothetical protein [Acidimicrobiia bacterium]